MYSTAPADWAIYKWLSDGDIYTHTESSKVRIAGHLKAKDYKMINENLSYMMKLLLPYGCTTWMLTKCIKKMIGTMQVILNKS